MFIPKAETLSRTASEIFSFPMYSLNSFRVWLTFFIEGISSFALDIAIAVGLISKENDFLFCKAASSGIVPTPPNRSRIVPLSGTKISTS